MTDGAPGDASSSEQILGLMLSRFVLFVLATVCSSCTALVLVPGAMRPALRIPTITLQEAGETAGETEGGRYDDAEARGRAALEAIQAETTEAEQKKAQAKAKADLAADAEGAPFNPIFGIVALAGGAVLGYLVNNA